MSADHLPPRPAYQWTMGAGSHDEEPAARARDSDPAVFLLPVPLPKAEERLQEEDSGGPFVDRGLWEKLEELELREDPAELGGMVMQVKQELLGLKDKPPSAVPAVSSFRQAMDSHDLGVRGSSDGRAGPRLSMPVRKMHPKLCQPGTSTGRLSQSPLRSLTSCGAREDEEFSVKVAFHRLMERLAKLERRLDKWNVDQQRRLEQVMYGKALVIGQRSGDGSMYRTGSMKRHQKKEMEEEASSSVQNGKHEVAQEWVTNGAWKVPPNGEKVHEVNGAAAVNGHAARPQGRTSNPEIAKAPSLTKAGTAASLAKMGEVPTRRRSSNFILMTKERESQKSQSQEELERRRKSSILSPVVSHPAFDYFFASVIMLNSLFIGVQADVRISNADTFEVPSWFDHCEKVFAALFLIELIMRAIALKWQFFAKKQIMWNVFDLTLVLMSVFEITFAIIVSDGSDSPSGKGGSVGKVIRMFRMVRIIRIMRVLRFLAELRVMVTLIIHSVRSLFWLLVLLVIILYVFAIFFTQGVTDHLMDVAPPPDEKSVLMKYYGGLFPSALTLFLSITGGISWIEVLDPLKATGPVFVTLFLIYVFFAVFSVLNIVTGVFVDGAIQRSAQERDLRLEKEKEQKKLYVTMLMDLLEEIDSGGTGVITRTELEEAFKSDLVRYSFSVLDIDIADSNYLFDMLDLDGSGEVDMEEFVSGCLRLKGNAKSIDIHTLMFEVKHLMKKVDHAVSGLPPMQATVWKDTMSEASD
eukprot:CAMPEP_0204603214 /NCGR_PEP_ID=MMETSP0661-20131031/57126_1 /ASSEMBLY_ACC=CAM_ASM_000606 /TAXON_ID=109239 /ORGANISM="Alexandrium margalefi, Strain AMGDE01CS-322" /LENGTH=751 /DNA_ID=CAMNT_0051614259 /DNA_START=22 /DNA_END=2277 /DNA_ORIENTATION=+